MSYDWASFYIFIGLKDLIKNAKILRNRINIGAVKYMGKFLEIFFFPWFYLETLEINLYIKIN